MERVGDQGHVGELVEEDLAIGRREIQGAARDRCSPGRRRGPQPVSGSLPASCLDDVEQLTGSHVDDRRDEVRAEVGREADEGGLVEPEGCHVIEAIRVVDQGRTVGNDGVIDRVPVTPELSSDLVDAATVVTERSGGVAASSVGECHAGMGDPIIDLGPRLVRAVSISTDEQALVPDERRGDPVDGQVAVGDADALLDLGDHPAARTAGRRRLGLDVDAQH